MMTQETYDYIWTQVEKSIRSIENKFSQREKDKWEFKRAYGSEYKAVIKEEYDTIKNQLKKRCYKEKDNEENKIDQHKIAACFCDAFLRRKAFDFRMDNSIPYEMLLSNYMVAYSVSLQIIYLCLLDLYSGSLDPEKRKLASALMEHGQLWVPATTITHDQYNLGRVKTLALNDYHNVSFDALGYADMMYWIEHYNRQVLEKNYLVDPIDPGEPFQD